MALETQTILITGAARRLGKAIALSLADSGAKLLLHYGHSATAAEETLTEVRSKGAQAELVQADLSNNAKVENLIDRAAYFFGPVTALVNNAAIFEDLDLLHTDLGAWQRHLQINLTAPFLISKAFAQQLPEGRTGRIVNMLDWRALRPGTDHFAYTISKAALASLTQSLALALAPSISVNGLALGAILPPVDGTNSPSVLEKVPLKRWAELGEFTQTIRFLLEGPAYITGEVIHLDGGRHLV